MPHRRRRQASGSPENGLPPLPSDRSQRSGGSPSGAQRLRRKVPIEDVLEEGTSSRRLVEYFVVVSSQPRWNVTRPSPPPPVEKTPTPVRVDSASKREILRASSRWMPARRKSSRLVENTTEEREPPGPSSESPRRSASPSKREDSSVSNGNIHLPKTADCEYTFQPMITARFPAEEYPDHALNPMIVQFCYPHSEDVILPSTKYEMPRIHHFVLTTDKGRKVYGTCLTVYEEYYPSSDDPYHLRRNETVHSESGELNIEVTVENTGRRKVMYIPRVLCLLSTWPYLTAFREYLTQLYRLATTTNLMAAPIERYILNLCEEIPAPPPGAFEIQVQILNSTIRFWAPPAKLPIPYVALPYQTLFDCLDVNNIVQVWYTLTLERSVLLVSSQYSILTVCAEILCSLLFPMQWSHLYIPLVPRFLSPMLEAPFPYLCGVVGENWMHAKPFVTEETMIVDLDSNTVRPGVRSLPPVPTKKWEKLQAALNNCAGELFWETRGMASERRQLESQKITQRQFDTLKEQEGDPRWKEKLSSFDFAFNLAYTPDSPNLLDDALEEKRQSQSDKVQEVFLRFFVSSFKGYRKFLQIPEDDTSVSPNASPRRWCQQRYFDRDGFLHSIKAEYVPFTQELCMTQMFDDFVTKRLYSPGEPDVIFFDQSIDAKNNRSRLKIRKVDTPFLQSAQAHKVLNVVTAVAPNSDGLPIPARAPEGKRTYVYKTWPARFNPVLFGRARPIPSMITAEFDRQSALVARLRAYQPENSTLMADVYGGDFDPSPEVATFTVFFFAYSAVIGREWQAFKQTRQQRELAWFAGEQDVELQLHETEKKPESSPVVVNDFVVESQGTSSDFVSPSILACPSTDCNICPEYANDALKFQEEFLAAFGGSYVVSPRGIPTESQAGLLDFDDALAEYEESKEVAAAQLELAFSALTTMSLRGLPTDPDAFKSLMEACGRCGDTGRALQLMETMKNDGFVTDGELYSSLMQAFAQGDGSQLTADKPGERHSDAYAAFLKKRLQYSKTSGVAEQQKELASSSEEGDSEVTSMFSSEGSEEDQQNSSIVSEFIYTTLFGSRSSATLKRKNKKNRKRRKGSLLTSSKILDTGVTDGIRKQIVLGESLIEFLYPDLVIDTSSDSCPLCSKQLAEDDIVAGWIPCEFHDYTTECPQCKHRFVPRFSVRCSAPAFEGSQGTFTPLYCEMLSPWVLRMELENIIHGDDGIGGMLNPEWRNGSDIRATLWWNLIVSFNRYRLPVSFLLQGSFQNRLINPTPDA